jgi:hypothetical protein
MEGGALPDGDGSNVLFDHLVGGWLGGAGDLRCSHDLISCQAHANGIESIAHPMADPAYGNVTGQFSVKAGHPKTKEPL